MAVNGNFLKLYNMMGNCRNLLSSRIIKPIYQPVATLKRSIEANAGLPSAPKKPLTPYFVFMKELRPTIIAKNPNLKITEVTKLLAEEWKKTDEQVKKKMNQEYQNRLQSYHVAKAHHFNSFTEEQRRQLEIAKLAAKHDKARKLQRKEIKDLGKPKRPAAAFALWASSLGAKRGSMKLSEWQKTLVPKWESLPEKEKAVFEAQALKAMNMYKIELKNWEVNMMKLGKLDLVRYGMKINPPKATENKKPSE